MRISGEYSVNHLAPHTRRLMQRMVGSLCGMNQRVSFQLRSREDPLFCICGGELTGVHLLRDCNTRHKPKPLSYHIGGAGVFLDEAMIRVLGETAERYAQLVSEIHLQAGLHTASFNEMQSRGEYMLPSEKMQFFTAEQFTRPEFPFQSFDPDTPMDWLRVPALTGCDPIWLPAQLILVGYDVRRRSRERWLWSAVTTGTATHSDPMLALRSALLELIQIDSAMGHWYGGGEAPRILLDRRTQAVEQLVNRTLNGDTYQVQFHFLPNADLEGLSVACVISRGVGFPSFGVGMGAGTRLPEAMYKAFLEAVALVQLAKIVRFFRVMEKVPEGMDGDTSPQCIDPNKIFDLDHNVAFYSDANSQSLLRRRFDPSICVNASELPADMTGSPHAQVKRLVGAFSDTGKTLVHLDLTTVDIRQMGLVTQRVWSPDLLGICLPSAPAEAHPRFQDYGGVHHDIPHPYP